MAIQWYPGHMTQARKKAEETMEFTDVVIEVLDAVSYTHLDVYKRQLQCLVEISDRLDRFAS